MFNVLTTAVQCLLFTVLQSSSVNGEVRQEEYNGFTYVTHGSDYVSYSDALSWCNEMGGQLPSIHSEADIQFIKQLCGSRFVWLGAKRVGMSWEWTDGSPFNYNDQIVSSCRAQCCGLQLFVTSKLAAYPSCGTYEITARKVCRLMNKAPEKAIAPVMELLDPLESRAHVKLLSQHQVHEAIANLTANLNRLSDESSKLFSERDANMTHRMDKFMLDTMSETSLRLRLLETSLNVSTALSSQSLDQNLAEFKQKASLIERLMQELRHNITQQAMDVTSEAENKTSSRIALMDMFLNNSSLTLNSSLKLHSDNTQSVLNTLTERFERDFEAKAHEVDRQLDQMNHRITILGIAILILPIFYLLILILRQGRGMGLGKSNQQLALSHYLHQTADRSAAAF